MEELTIKSTDIEKIYVNSIENTEQGYVEYIEYKLSNCARVYFPQNTYEIKGWMRYENVKKNSLTFISKLTV